jgi:ABC-type iron transport system FetAB permease component
MTNINNMNEDLVNSLTGRQSVLKAALDAAQSGYDDCTAALALATTGWQTDQAAQDAAVTAATAPLQSQVTTLIAQLAAVEAALNPTSTNN